MFKPKAFLFDLDNTLIDRRAIFKPFSGLFVDRFMPGAPNREECMETLRILDDDGNATRPALFERLFGRLGLPMPPSDEMLRFWNTVQPECMVTMPGMHETLTKLKQAGVKLALVTNGVPELQNGKIEKAGIRRYFDAVLISGETGFHKPDIRIFKLALSRLDVGAGEAVFVGDHPVNDVYGAQNAGIRAIRMNYFGDEGGRCGAKPFLEIHRLEELAALVGN